MPTVNFVGVIVLSRLGRQLFLPDGDMQLLVLHSLLFYAVSFLQYWHLSSNQYDPLLFFDELQCLPLLTLVWQILHCNLLFATAAILRLSFNAYARLVQFSGELHKNVTWHLQMLAVILVPVIMLCAGSSPQWVPLLFGARWSKLPQILFVLAPGYFVAAVFDGILNPAVLVCGSTASCCYG